MKALGSFCQGQTWKDSATQLNLVVDSWAKERICDPEVPAIVVLARKSAKQSESYRCLSCSTSNLGDDSAMIIETFVCL